MHLRALVLSVLVLAIPGANFASEASAKDVLLITYGKDNPVCRDVAKLAKGLERDDFSRDTWKEVFRKIEWIPLGKPFVAYVVTDINNDGTVDLVVRHQDMFRSVVWDWLYVVTPSQLEAVKKTGSTEALTSGSAELSPRNEVKFTNGKLAVPVSSHIWRRRGKNYLVMMEDFFAREEQTEEGRTLPNALYVGLLLGPESSRFDPIYKVQRLYPTMVCRIEWK